MVNDEITEVTSRKLRHISKNNDFTRNSAYSGNNSAEFLNKSEHLLSYSHIFLTFF